MSNDTLFQEALTHFPGGVSSPVRAFRAVGGTPKFFKKASGAWFEDEDGQRFLDLCMSWGPLILGHAHPDILAAVTESMQEGLTFGAPSRRELALARKIKAMVPFVEKMRFVSSGTEAVMSALRAARGFSEDLRQPQEDTVGGDGVQEVRAAEEPDATAAKAPAE